MVWQRKMRPITVQNPAVKWGFFTLLLACAPAPTLGADRAFTAPHNELGRLHAGLNGPRTEMPVISVADTPSVQRKSLHPGIFPPDTRQPVPSWHAEIAAAVGVLINPHVEGICTAFCIAPDVIATAGHCAVDRRGTINRDGVQRLRFLRRPGPSHAPAQPDRSMLSGEFRAGTRQPRSQLPMSGSDDWIVARLASSACGDSAIQLTAEPQGDLERTRAAAAAGRLRMLAFHADRWSRQAPAPLFSARCNPIPPAPAHLTARRDRHFTSVDAIIFHRCDIAGFSSGGPMFLETADGRLHLVAVNSGTYEMPRTVARWENNGSAGSTNTYRINVAVHAGVLADVLQVVKPAP